MNLTFESTNRSLDPCIGSSTGREERQKEQGRERRKVKEGGGVGRKV